MDTRRSPGGKVSRDEEAGGRVIGCDRMRQGIPSILIRDLSRLAKYTVPFLTEVSRDELCTTKFLDHTHVRKANGARTGELTRCGQR